MWRQQQQCRALRKTWTYRRQLRLYFFYVHSQKNNNNYTTFFFFFKKQLGIKHRMLTEGLKCGLAPRLISRLFTLNQKSTSSLWTKREEETQLRLLAKKSLIPLIVDCNCVFQWRNSGAAHVMEMFYCFWQYNVNVKIVVFFLCLQMKENDLF